MANSFIKPEVVLRAGIGALERDVVLTNLVWRDAFGDFKGAKNDTIFVRIPAVTSARSRELRSGATRSRDQLAEARIAVTLDTNLYKDVLISDEEMTLDIQEFGPQVMTPIVNAMVRGYEEEVADLMQGAAYEVEVDWDSNDPHATLVDAATALNLANVPASGRSVVLGANLAGQLVKSDQVRRFDSAGAAAAGALLDATVARLAGFSNIVVSNLLDPNVGFAFHRTAYVLAARAPVVPAGVAWGASLSANGFALRAIRQFDSSADGWVDVLGFDAYAGSDVVKDHGSFDDDGRWVPAVDPDNSGGSDLKFVRAVKIVGTASS